MKSHSRHGFATLTATILLVLVAMALSAISFTLRLNLERTRAASREAQVQQLMLAGVISLLDNPPDHPEESITIPTPRSLDSEITIVPDQIDDDWRRYKLGSSFQGVTSWVRIDIERRDGQWVVIESEIINRFDLDN